MFDAILGVITRHGGNALGSLLAANGLATGSEAEIAFGGLVVFATFAWSVFQKYRSKDKPVGEI